jgi:hypothetical protein
MARSRVILPLIVLIFIAGLTVPNDRGRAGAVAEAAAPEAVPFDIITGVMTLKPSSGELRSEVKFRAEKLTPNAPTELIWMTVEGSYKLDGIYAFIQPEYEEREVVLLTGRADRDGVWEGKFTVPEGFGGDHTLYVRQSGKKIAQSGFYVEPTFHISPTSGPVGTEITVTSEGIGWTDMHSNFQLTYDNKMTGLLSAVTTNGKAEAKIRAAGPPGVHTISIWRGYLGMPYINHEQSPNSPYEVPNLLFEVTDEVPRMENYVEAIPDTAAVGVEMPELQNKPGVQVRLNKEGGIVGEEVILQATGLPASKPVQLVWNTMRGNRISATGFAEHSTIMGEASSDRHGKLDYSFAIPDDLGGVPHRIDVVMDGHIYGQAYLHIYPSIVSMSPMSGPAGTAITIEIKGVGWTEYDNAYFLTYDNAYTGYMCGFNSQGTVKFTLYAAGEPGYHIIDLYPGIYKGEKKQPNIYVAPQLTYQKDHPGSAIPAIRLGFEVTE